MWDVRQNGFVAGVTVKGVVFLLVSFLSLEHDFWYSFARCNIEDSRVETSNIEGLSSLLFWTHEAAIPARALAADKQ